MSVGLKGAGRIEVMLTRQPHLRSRAVELTHDGLDLESLRFDRGTRLGKFKVRLLHPCLGDPALPRRKLLKVLARVHVDAQVQV